jgi:hypothetical protein
LHPNTTDKFKIKPTLAQLELQMETLHGEVSYAKLLFTGGTI